MPTVTPAPICSYLDDDFPIPRRLRPLAVALVELEYTDLGVSLVVSHANVNGSLACCPHVFECHRDQLEEHVPDAPEAEWAMHDRFVYAPGPEAPR